MQSRQQYACRRVRIRYDRRPAAAKNPRFFPADGLAGFSKKFHVVDADAGENRAIRIQYVYRVQPAAQADFEYQRFKILIGEENESRKRSKLEIGQRHRAARPLDRFKGRAERRIVRLAAGDAHALVVAQQVRRGVQAGAIAGGLEDRFEHRTGGTFAVGPANRENRAGKFNL